MNQYKSFKEQNYAPSKIKLKIINALIDTGASHSYILKNLSKTLNIEDLQHPIKIEFANEERVEIIHHLLK